MKTSVFRVDRPASVVFTISHSAPEIECTLKYLFHERQAIVEQKVHALKQEMALHELSKARQQSQADLAERLEVNQPAVSLQSSGCESTARARVDLANGIKGISLVP
jgi:hypothetical protein